MPIRKAIVPAASDEVQRDAYAANLAGLGRETTVMVSRGVDGNNGYDLELVEAKDTAWESFPGLRDSCDLDIVLAILTQNLTTEVKSGGSYAASNTHERGLARVVAANNMAWCGRKGDGGTIRNQIARPFAWINFGDPNLAPKTRYDVPEDDYTDNADRWQKFTTGVEVLARGGVEFTDQDELRRFARDRFGLRDFPEVQIGKPPTGASGGGFGK
jgi:phage gp29-like protein